MILEIIHIYRTLGGKGCKFRKRGQTFGGKPGENEIAETNFEKAVGGFQQQQQQSTKLHFCSQMKIPYIVSELKIHLLSHLHVPCNVTY